MSNKQSSLKLNINFSKPILKRQISSFEDLLKKENLKKIIYEIKILSLLFSINYCFNDLRFKIDPLIRIIGEKIWARRILEDDYNLPFYMQTYQNSDYMKFFAKWKKDSEENLKQKCIEQSRKNDLFFKQKNTLILIFLDHQMNFFKFSICIKKFSEILNRLNDNDKKKFFEKFNNKIQNFDEEKDNFLEIHYISSINNIKKGFGDRVLKLFLKNIDQIINLFELNEISKKYLFATYHPENFPSGNLLLRNGFEKVTEESFYIEDYNAPRNFVFREITIQKDKIEKNSHLHDIILSIKN